MTQNSHSQCYSQDQHAFHVAHFFQQCEQDWFDLDPKRFTMTVKLFTGCSQGCVPPDSTHSHRAREQRLRELSTPENPGLLADLVGLVAVFEDSVVPVCDSMDDDTVNTLSMNKLLSLPVLISLWSHQLRSGHTRTQRDVCSALNAIREDFGDTFTHANTPVFKSLFGAHWDNIELRDSAAAGARKCRLCEVKRLAVEVYLVEAEELKAQRHAAR